MHSTRHLAVLAAASVIIVGSLLFAASPAHAGSEFTDFRLPAHHWSSWSALEDVAFSRSRLDQPGNSGEYGQLNLNLASTALWGYDSDRLRHQFLVSGQTTGGRIHSVTSTDTPPSFATQASGSQSISEAVRVNASITAYPTLLPVGAGLFFDFASSLQQDWNSIGGVQKFRPDEVRSSSDEHVDRHAHNLFAGAQLSLGRVRDVTPVYRTIILEQRLARTGRLQHALSPVARERVAGLFAISPRFGQAHERAARFFWAEVERVLRDDGALEAGTIDAVSMLMLLDPVGPAGLLSRASGFSSGPEVGASAARQHIDRDRQDAASLWQSGVLQSTSRSSSSFVGNSRSDALYVAWNTAYSRPFGPDWQFDANHRLIYIDASQRLQSSLGASLVWMVADRWRATFGTSHNADANDSRGSRKITNWSVRTRASLEYFLEDAWSLGLSCDQNQTHGPRDFRRDESVRLGVRHLFNGLLAAPHLMEPTRLSPPTH